MLHTPKLPNDFTAIDSHIHLFPEKLFKAIWKWFDEHGWNIIFKWEISDLVVYLREMGIQRAACLIYAHRSGMASELNRWVARLAEQESLIIPFGSFHQDDPPDTVLNEALDTLSLSGIKIHCNVQRVCADDSRLFPLYEHLQNRGRILVIHAGTQPLHDEFVGLDYLHRVLEKFPTLRVQIAHLGAGEFQKTFTILKNFPNVMLDTSIIFNDRLQFLPKEHREDIIRFADRIIYGSDFPNIWYTPEAGIASLSAYNFPENVIHKILFKNAEKFYGVK